MVGRYSPIHAMAFGCAFSCLNVSFSDFGVAMRLPFSYRALPTMCVEATRRW